MMQSRTEALALLHEYTKSESLIKHALAVEAAMRWYAGHFQLSPAEVEQWSIVGLLHDFDYERYPGLTPEGHPFQGNKILKELGYSREITDAILSHASFSGVPRDTLMAKTLFAVDELAGFITASVLVRPDRSLHTLEAKSVRKKMKDKAFARACNREEITEGARELGIELDQHITNVIAAMRMIAPEPGLAGG